MLRITVLTNKRKGACVMRKWMKKLQKFALAACVMATAPLAAHAEPAFFTAPTSVDISEVGAYAGIIVAALVGMIVVRKAIKLTNRS